MFSVAVLLPCGICSKRISLAGCIDALIQQATVTYSEGCLLCTPDDIAATLYCCLQGHV